MNCIEFFINIIRDDAFRNIVALLAPSVAIWGIIQGGIELDRFYYNRRLCALESFYSQMRMHLLYFKNLLGKKGDEFVGYNYPFSCAFFALSKNANFSAPEDYDREDPVISREIALLSNFSKEFLGFLLKATNQTPDFDKEKHKLWKENIENLIMYLTHFENMCRGITISQLSIDDGITKVEKKRNNLIQKITSYHQDIDELIMRILDDITRYEENTLEMLTKYSLLPPTKKSN